MLTLLTKAKQYSRVKENGLKGEKNLHADCARCDLIKISVTVALSGENFGKAEEGNLPPSCGQTTNFYLILILSI